MRSIATIVEAVTPSVLKRFGVVHTRLLLNWAKMVDPEMLELTYPKKLVKDQDGRVLYIAAASGGVAVRMQHSTIAILERINRFLGYKAVEKIKVVRY